MPEETNVALLPELINEASSSTEAIATSAKEIVITKVGGTSWRISGLDKEMDRQEIPITYRVNTKIANPKIIVRLEKKLEDGQAYVFGKNLSNRN